MSANSGAQRAGFIVGNTLQGGTMIWAALETSGAVRVMLWVCVAIIALGLMVSASLARIK